MIKNGISSVSSGVKNGNIKNYIIMKKIFLSVVMAVSTVLSSSAQTTAETPVTVENPNLKVTLSNITLIPGGEAAYLTVSEECEGGNYAAFPGV